VFFHVLEKIFFKEVHGITHIWVSFEYIYIKICENFLRYTYNKTSKFWSIRRNIFFFINTWKNTFFGSRNWQSPL